MENEDKILDTCLHEQTFKNFFQICAFEIINLNWIKNTFLYKTVCQTARS